MNIGTFPARRARLTPAALAAVDGARRITFAELDARCNGVAHMLRRLGVGRGSRVAVLLLNSLEWLECLFAAARVGAIVVPLNWRLEAADLAAICGDAGAETLIFTPQLAAFDELLSRHPFVSRVAVGGAIRREAVPYEEALAGAPHDPVEPSEGGEDPLLIIYTSGTTGRPKGAVHTHRHWYWAAATIAASEDLRPQDRGLVVAPMYHVGGLVMSTLHVYVGAASVYLRAFEAEMMLRVIRDERIAHFLCVPTMLHRIRQLDAFEGADFSSVRWCYSVGAPTPPALIAEFFRRGLRVQTAYGLTETGGPATVVPAAAVLEKAGTAGVPYFHTDVRIATAAGTAAPPGTTGEVEIRGPHVIDGYWRNPEASEAALHEGWLRTGDIGRIDADGFLTLLDRKHDLILSGGENIYPSEVERVLFEHAGVADAAVFGLADDAWGEVVCAAVQPQTPGPTEAELIAFCRSRLAGYKVPKRIFFVEEVPRTATGKSLRRELRRRLGVNA